MRKTLMITALWMGLCSHSFAQKNASYPYPKIGEKIANVTFTNVINYPDKTVNMSNFKGKWLILDIWNHSCSACIASFPRMDKLQEKFKDEAQLIMIGANKANSNMLEADIQKEDKANKDIYEKLNEKFHFKMTIAFDSIAYLKFDGASLPYVLVIDPTGILVAKTQHIDEEQVGELIAGKHPVFEKQYSEHEPVGNENYNKTVPLLTNGAIANGGVDSSYLFRSLLMLQTTNLPLGGSPSLFAPNWADVVNRGRLEVFNGNLWFLYHLAYFGEGDWGGTLEDTSDKYKSWSVKPLLLTKDSTLFARNDLPNDPKYKKYAYSLTVPKSKSTPEYLMQVMQADLKKYFDYDSSLELIQRPVYFIEIDDKEKAERLIAKKREPTRIKNGYGHFQVTYLPMDKFINYFYVFSQILKSPDDALNIYNATGIHQPVTFDFRANMKDEDDMQNALKKNGLRIVKRYKELLTLVIRDAVPQVSVVHR